MSAELRLSAEALALMRAAAAASPSHEVCGLLVETDGVVQAISSPNRHPDPGRGFAICDALYARIQRETRAMGGKVVGCFHSHPSGDTSPSDTDLLAARQDGFIWVICSPGGRLQAWSARVGKGARWFEPMSLKTNVEAQSPLVAAKSAH